MIGFLFVIQDFIGLSLLDFTLVKGSTSFSHSTDLVQFYSLAQARAWPKIESGTPYWMLLLVEVLLLLKTEEQEISGTDPEFHRLEHGRNVDWPEITIILIIFIIGKTNIISYQYQLGTHYFLFSVFFPDSVIRILYYY